MFGVVVFFFFSSRRRHTRCALVTGVQTCALPILIPSATFDRLADEAVRITPQHLGELAAMRRHATLATAAIRLEESLTDAALTMFDKLLGSMVRRAENRTRDKAIRTVRDRKSTRLNSSH